MQGNSDETLKRLSLGFLLLYSLIFFCDISVCLTMRRACFCRKSLLLVTFHVIQYVVKWITSLVKLTLDWNDAVIIVFFQIAKKVWHFDSIKCIFMHILQVCDAFFKTIFTYSSTYLAKEVNGHLQWIFIVWSSLYVSPAVASSLLSVCVRTVSASSF